MSKILPLLLFFAVACSFAGQNFQTRHATDIDSRRIRRIAVVSPSTANAEQKAKIPYTSPSPADSKASDQDTADLLAKFVYAAMTALAGWQIVGDSEVREAADSLEPMDQAARLRKIGEMVYADAVMVGRVQRYQERVGNELGVRSPASVAFVLDLIDLRRGDVVWSGRFDETQKPLSENILAIGDIGQRGIRWLTADQLMQDGVRRAVGQLHGLLVRNP